MRTKNKARTHGHAQETNGSFPLDWLDEAVARSAEPMDYRQSTPKQLVDDFFWALPEVPRLLEYMGRVGRLMRNPLVPNNAAVGRPLIAFLAKGFHLVACLVAVLTTGAPEIVKRANKNQTNKWFGLLKLAHMRGDTGAQGEALPHLQRLGWGIAKNKGWFHPDGNDGWNSPVNLALTEQLNRFSNLGLRETYEYMVDNRFAVVAIAIRQRFVDELRALYRQQPSQHVSDDFLESVPSLEPSPEEMAQFAAIPKLVESSGSGLCDYERGIYAAVEVVFQDLRLPAMTVPQLRAELVRRIAAARSVSPQQAREDLRKFRAEKDKHWGPLANRLSISPSQWRRGRNYRRRRPVHGVDEDDSA